jgi:hypothetical protein
MGPNAGAVRPPICLMRPPDRSLPWIPTGPPGSSLVAHPLIIG